MILPPVPVLVCLAPAQKTDTLISVDFKDTPIRSAIESIFKNSGIKNYIIDNHVNGNVTLSAKNKSVESVLALILSASRIPLIYTKEGGVWIVKPLPQPTTVLPTPSETTDRPVSKWTTIPVRYRTVSELAPLLGGIATMGKPLPELKMMPNPNYSPNQPNQRTGFGGGSSPMIPIRSLLPPGIETVVAVGNGTLLVQGDPADIQELKELIQQLDVPVPSVECRIEVVSVSAGKKNRNMLLQTMETGKCGTEIKAVSKTVGTAAQSSRLDVTIKATPLGGNEFEVETRWEASVPLPGAQKGQLVRLEKTFSNTRRVKGGATMMFGGVVLKEEQGVSASGQEVLFFLTLKPF